MSRAEELARWHEAMAAEPKRNEGKRKRHAESVAELRRMSAVEAELIALKKAIGDAEPVAWIVEGQTMGGGVSQYLAWKKSGAGQVPAPLRTAPEPLYTLKGIK